MIATLMFVTLAAALGFGVFQMLAFMRRGGNRAIAEDALVGDSERLPYTWNGTDGALPDIGAFAGFAVFGMLLLLIGAAMSG